MKEKRIFPQNASGQPKHQEKKTLRKSETKIAKFLAVVWQTAH